MIANITSGNSFTGLIMYNEKKVQKGQAERLYSNIFGIESSNQQLISGLEKVAAKRPKIDNKTFHVSLALAEGDKLSQDKLVEMGNQYMKLMGYENTPFITYRHNDTGIDHLHIVSTRVDIDGNKVNDSMERYNSQRAARKLEIQFGITVVSSVKQTPDEAKKSKSTGDDQDVINTKHAISLAIQQVLHKNKATNYEDFVRHLAKLNVIAQQVKVDAEKNNLVTPGMMFSLGRSITPETKRIKGSAFHQGYTYAKILTILNTNLIIEQTEPTPKRSKVELKKALSSILAELKSPEINSVEALNKLFGKHQIEPIYFKNTGGIYGLKIKDLLSDEVHKASDIDRGFSWNAIQKLLDGTESNTAKKAPKSIPFIVNIASDPDAKPIEYVKNISNKKVISNPILRVINNLSNRGFVSQDELNNELKIIGYKALFSRDFAKEKGGITGISYTEIATGKTYSGAMLDYKNLSWKNLSRFVANDLPGSNFENHVKKVLSQWQAFSTPALKGNMDEMMIFLNLFGITIQQANDKTSFVQIGGRNKIAVESILSNPEFKGLFNQVNAPLSAQTVNGLNTQGYVHKPLLPIERVFVSAIYSNSKEQILTNINAGDRIDLRNLKLNLAAGPGIETYKNITTLQHQIANVLKFAVFNNATIQERSASNDQVKLPFDLFVKSLNKRGVGVRYDLNSANKAESLSFFLKNKPESKLDVKDLPGFITNEKLESLVGLSTTLDLKDRLEENNGFDIRFTDRQIELFKAAESDNEYIQKAMISQGTTISLSAMEVDYFEYEINGDQYEESESTTQSISYIKEFAGFLDALLQVAQGEIPVSRDTSKKKKEKRKKREPGMGY